MKTPIATLQILSSADREAGLKLHVEYEQHNRRFMSLTYEALRQRWTAARLAYDEDPNDDTFEELKSSSLAKDFFSHNSSCRSQARAALKSYFNRHIAPWAVAVLDRALVGVKASARRVRAAENARTVQLLGRPAAENDIIAAAEASVRQLEAMRDRLAQQESFITGYSSPSKLLATFDAIGSPDFDQVLSAAFDPQMVASAVAEMEAAELAASAEEEAADDEDLPDSGES